MDFSSLIEKKKHNEELSKDEIYYLVNSYINGEIKDYQMSSFLMAVWFNSLTDKELLFLTQAMMDSGEKFEFKNVKGICVDKHSTGGIGDKTSLIFGPILAYFGLYVGKMSGRGLGQTGGTIDKLESIPGWTFDVTTDKFEKMLLKNHLAIIGQSKNIVPADKLLYALRDTTGTVDSDVLISSSIMSKKLVMDSDCIILDVKVGDGAFMKDVESAKRLSSKMATLAKLANRKLGVILSDMNKPLGKAIGNAIEVKEAYDTLLGNGPDDLVELVSFACALALFLTKERDNLKKAKEEVLEVIKSKKAAPYLKKMIEEQGGNFSVMDDYDKYYQVKHQIQIKAKSNGYLKFTSTYDMGMLGVYLGAGRFRKEDPIDPAAGIYLNKQSGDIVQKGDLIMTLYTNKSDLELFEEKANKLIEITKKEDKNNIVIDYIV